MRPRTLLGPIGAPRHALGVHKNSVGRRIIIILSLFSYVYILLLALGVLPPSIRWKKPIHSLQLFFAAAIWLVSPNRTDKLK